MKAIVRSCIVLLAIGVASAAWAVEDAKESAVVKPLSGVVLDDGGTPIAAADVVYSWWTNGLPASYSAIWPQHQKAHE